MSFRIRDVPFANLNIRGGNARRAWRMRRGWWPAGRRRLDCCMKRREFLTFLGLAAAWPLAAPAQQPQRVQRIAVLERLAADDPVERARMAAFLGGLQTVGWSDGRNLRIDYRWNVGAQASFAE